MVLNNDPFYSISGPITADAHDFASLPAVLSRFRFNTYDGTHARTTEQLTLS